ncbi:CHASE2 domain-containing protein [Thiolapillus brandeum]|uniref:diguanylate cyclase n=1 Tax=Thiolapillus brandeum TaxID=1076588 RepID=A0A7U6JJV5_9GAMM|nr:CHASE2 domain-containing protein [Thiolapillus brandeum]BAO45160.1 signal transduction protein [Thiolapillus brandeum]
MKELFDKLGGKPVTYVLGAVLLAVLVDWSGITWRMEQMVVDTELRLVRAPVAGDIAIVAIDEKSLREYGPWPWSRQLYARLLDHLQDAGAGTVAFDILFADPRRDDAEGDQAFAEAIERHGRVVLAMSSDRDISSGTVSEILPRPLFARPAAAIGHTDLPIDQDGILRGVYLQAGSGAARWPQLALAALLLDTNRKIAHLPGHESVRGGYQGQGRWIRNHRILFPFSSESNPVLAFSFADVVEGKVRKSLLAGKTIFVGVTAQGLQRLFLIPGGGNWLMSGVEIQANVLSALEQDALLTELRGWPRWIVLALLSALGGMVVALYRRNCVTKGLILGLLVTGGASLILLLFFGVITPTIPMWVSLAVMAFLANRRQVLYLQYSSGRDTLTGLCNRRSFEEHYQRMWRINERHQRPLFLLILDVDHFKRLNDAMGHLHGDEVLRKLGAYLKSKTRRAGDRACRIGGEEFAILLDMDEPDMQRVHGYAQQIVDDVRDLGISYSDAGQDYCLTLSIGCASMVPGESSTPDALFDAADQALYQAKKAGRNQVWCYESDKQPAAPNAVEDKLYGQ